MAGLGWATIRRGEKTKEHQRHRFIPFVDLYSLVIVVKHSYTRALQLGARLARKTSYNTHCSLELPRLRVGRQNNVMHFRRERGCTATRYDRLALECRITKRSTHPRAIRHHLPMDIVIYNETRAIQLDDSFVQATPKALQADLRIQAQG